MGSRILKKWILAVRIWMGLCPHRCVGAPTYELSRGERGVFVICHDCNQKINYCLVDQAMLRNNRRFC